MIDTKFPFDWRSERVTYTPPEEPAATPPEEPAATLAQICGVLEADQVQADRVEFLLNAGGVGFCSRGNVHALVSKRKQGKSFAGMAKAAALVSGEFGRIHTDQGQKYKVLVIDTEQDESDIKQRKAAVIEAAQITEEEAKQNLLFICARHIRKDANFWSCPTLQDWRKRLLIECVKAYRPDYVLLDGIRELVKDKNDQSEATEIRELLSTLAAKYRCAIDCVCHENEKQGKETAIGAIGTELENMCDDFTQCEKQTSDSGTSIIIRQSAQYSRHKAPDSWSISIADNWRFTFAEYEEPAEQKKGSCRSSAGDFREASKVIELEEKLKSVLTDQERESGITLNFYQWKDKLKPLFADKANPRTETARFIGRCKKHNLLVESSAGLEYESEI